VAELRDVLYAVVPDRSGWPALRQALTGAADALVAAGPPALPTELAGSRALAEEMLNLLRTGLIAGPVVSHEEAWTVLALHRSATGALAAGATEFGPLTMLGAQDERAGTSYVDTLYEWLRHPGDPRAASKALRIHPNTLRYRMTKLVELAGVDLDDPDTRMALVVQLATRRWA
jgi:sugar diacid utilization regulator